MGGKERRNHSEQTQATPVAELSKLTSFLPNMLNPPPTPGLGNEFWVLNRYSSKIKESDSTSVSQMQGLLAQH